MGLRNRSEDEIPTLNLTSLIDVLMLLIIFFMAGTKFIEDERQIELKLPQVQNQGGPLTAAPQKRLVNVYRDGTISLDGHTVSLEQLTAQLKRARTEYKSIGVVVRGDGATPHQQMVSVYQACKKSGIVDVGIAVLVANAETEHGRR